MLMAHSVQELRLVATTKSTGNKQIYVNVVGILSLQIHADLESLRAKQFYSYSSECLFSVTTTYNENEYEYWTIVNRQSILIVFKN